ncbi:pyrroline-5-carboxylate reductase [Pleionea mediterranea]|jgi:pyrroline-5-carboxylate reductase|uniref:Pyrroline-5-carboxylate reductase n=1 Tax=Pleionea mediterranea TaxID=523701 RepID=A0A316FGM7_9GAMM|nr:pyrroline-5-carboxylate reductase [Pleionea mediterranea]PWK46866.1 pyrroline-5-carboxylate reductase [Pleionea mediterranea]
MSNQNQQLTIGFIGAGNMASAIARGLVKKGHNPEKVIMSNRSAGKLEQLADELSVQTTQNNQEVCDKADVILLSVKPQMMADAISELDFSTVQVAVSVAAGLTTDNLKQMTQNKVAMVRSMPNTPSIELCGATGLYADDAVKKQHAESVNYVFGAIGEFEWVPDENLMDTVTALAGSSPAYFFRFMETLIEAGTKQGMDEQTARNLVVQSALGAATLIKNHPDIAISERRTQVTSPNGTTAAALDSLEQSGIADMADKAVKAAVNRGKELSEGK